MSLDYPNIMAPLLERFHPIIMRRIMPIIKESKLILAYLAKIFIAQPDLIKNSKVTPNKRLNPVNKVILIENSGEKVKEVNFSEPKSNPPPKRNHQSTDLYESPFGANNVEVEKDIILPENQKQTNEPKDNMPI